MKTKSVWKVISLVGAVVLLAACPEAGTEDSSGDPNGDSTGGGDVIPLVASGIAETTAGERTSCYVTFAVDSDGGIGLSAVSGDPEITVLETPIGCTSTRAWGVIETGSEIIACGYWRDASYVMFPTSWTNGVRSDLPLPDPATDYQGQALCIDETGQYMGGYAVADDVSVMIGCYWDDGTLVEIEELPDGVEWSEVSAATFVDGDGLYLAGTYVIEATGYMPAVWHVASDGTQTRTDLSRPSGIWMIQIDDIAVSGSDVYVLGSCGDPQFDDTATICYWLNGTRTDVETAEYVDAGSIGIAAAGVFIAGTTADWGDYMPENFQANVWRNSTRITLDDVDSTAAVAVFSGDHMVVGGYSTNAAGNDVGTIWVIPDIMAEIPPASITALTQDIDNYEPCFFDWIIPEFHAMSPR